MMKTNWSLIPSGEVSGVEVETYGSITVEVMDAYFDVPSATRFVFDEYSKELAIVFKYLTDSESTKIEVQGDVSLHIGKKTKRIYEIRIKGAAIKAETSKEITFKIVMNADDYFKKNIERFKGLNKRNSVVVEKCLDWGIKNKQLDLASVS